MAGRQRELSIARPPVGTWVQVERQAHEQWAALSVAEPRASALLHVLISNMGRGNAVVASQSTLAQLAACSVSTVKRSLEVLRREQWIEVRQLGATGTGCAYVINARVAWQGARDGIRYSLFDAAVIVSSQEQPDRAEIEAGLELPPLHHVPAVYAGERQVPTGTAPSPDLPDLPTRRRS